MSVAAAHLLEFPLHGKKKVFGNQRFPLDNVGREKHKETIIKFFRNEGIKVGRGCNICCNILTPEPFLITIGNNVTISSEVLFVTHDNSIMKINPKTINLFGHIIIGDNCFIGQRSTVLYGVELANNVIVAAGSVVCNSFDKERIIIGGNPARIIGTWDEFIERNAKKAMGRMEVKNKVISNPELFIKRKVR